MVIAHKIFVIINFMRLLFVLKQAIIAIILFSTNKEVSVVC